MKAARRGRGGDYVEVPHSPAFLAWLIKLLLGKRKSSSKSMTAPWYNIQRHISSVFRRRYAACFSHNLETSIEVVRLSKCNLLITQEPAAVIVLCRLVAVWERVDCQAKGIWADAQCRPRERSMEVKDTENRISGPIRSVERRPYPCFIEVQISYRNCPNEANNRHHWRQTLYIRL